MQQESLNQIHYLEREIQMWKKELSRLQGQEAILKNRVAKTVSQIEQRENTVIRNQDGVALKEQIQNILSGIEAEKTAMMDYIASVPDSLMRQILFYRHVNGLSWCQVAQRMGGGNTEGSVKMMYKRYWDKN